VRADYVISYLFSLEIARKQFAYILPIDFRQTYCMKSKCTWNRKDNMEYFYYEWNSVHNNRKSLMAAMAAAIHQLKHTMLKSKNWKMPWPPQKMVHPPPNCRKAENPLQEWCCPAPRVSLSPMLPPQTKIDLLKGGSNLQIPRRSSQTSSKPSRFYRNPHGLSKHSRPCKKDRSAPQDAPSNPLKEAPQTS